MSSEAPHRRFVGAIFAAGLALLLALLLALMLRSCLPSGGPEVALPASAPAQR